MNISHDSRLTDSLERELLAQAFEDHYRPHPIRAIGNLISKIKVLRENSLAIRGAGAIKQMV